MGSDEHSFVELMNISLKLDIWEAHMVGYDIETEETIVRVFNGDFQCE